MQSGFARSMAAAVIGGAAVLMAGSSIASASTTGPKAVVLPTIVVTARPAATKAEPHPEIMEAIRSLEHAREHLEHAAHDFGGHRVQAIGAIDAALNQLRLALKYDRR